MIVGVKKSMAWYYCTECNNGRDNGPVLQYYQPAKARPTGLSTSSQFAFEASIG